MEQKTDALQQSAESIDMETLIHRISCDESVLDKIKDENILLFLGTSNAGKTTTGCFLSGKQLVFKQITFTVGDEEFVGEEVIDKVDTNGQFKIGHASDSTTKSIQICDVSSRGLILADSCGFEDTEGCTVDVANAVSLKNAMTSCHSFHPVVVVDERSISISKGMPFVKLLKLICRFFSPLNLFLHSVSFLFTHVDPGTTPAAIRTKLAKLAQADHIKRDEDLNGIMLYLLDFVKKHEANCILYAEDITSRDAGSVEQRRDSLLDMITGLAPVTRGISNQLACPLSDEAQVSLQERSGALCYSVEMSLQQHQYKDTLRDMELLKTMHTALQLPRVTAAFEKATQAVQRHVEKLNETARSYLKDFRELSELDLIMTHLRNAQALQSFHDVKIVFTCLKSDINDEVKALVDKVTSREQPDYHGDAAVLDTLRSVKEILHPYLYSDFYTHALQHVEKSIEGHNSTCEKSLLAFKTAIGAEMYKDAKDDVGAKEAPQKLASTDKKKNNKKDKQKKKTGSDLEEDSSSSGSSGWLSGLLFGQKKGNKSDKGNKSERAVLKDVSNVEETSSSAEPDFDLSQIAAMGRIRLSSRDNGETSLDDVTCDLEEDGTSGSFEWFCDLFVSLSQLRKVERLHEHVSAAQVNYYCKQAGVLSELLQTICILVLGSKGLLRAVDRLSASAEQCLTLSQMHRLLRACFRHDANCHLIDPTLKSLDESVQSETIRILTRHVNSIDELDHQQKYGEIPVILELISNISLDGGALDDFRARHVHHRVDMLSKRVCKLHRQIETLISSLRDRDVLESCDIAELVHLVNIQSSAAGLDKFLLLSDSSPSTHSTGEDFSETASVTQWLDAYMQMISEMWTSTFSSFMKVATSDEGWIYESASLKREFVRLDRMNALGSLLTCVSEHSQQIVDAMNTKKERVVKKDVSSDTSSTEMHQLLELKDGLYLVFKAMESSPLLSRHELTEKWSSNCIADLVAWEKQSTVYIIKHLEDVRSACKDSLAAKNSQELGKQLDVLQDFADTEGLAKYVKPAPRKLYDETKVALQQEINSMITSSELAVSRGELEKASAIRVFLEGSSSFGHHFPEVDFRDFCTGLLQKHRQATDQLPAEIAGLLERHKFGTIKSKIRNLRSDDMSDGESKCDPADRLVFGDIDEQITDWFHELEAQIQDVANSEMGEQELTSKLETHLRTVSHAMALRGIISYDPVQLLEMVYGICNEQFERLRLRLLKKLGTHRFQQASTSYSQLKRMKNLDRSLHSHIDKLSAGGGEDGHLFTPRVERITANEVNAIGENVRVACLRYLGSDSAITSKSQSIAGPEEGDDVSEISTEGSPPAAVDVGELSALLTNTRSAANANDVLFDDLVDFSRVLSDIVRTISDVASRRLKKVQNLIMSASISEAAELLESIDNVVGILPAEESNASIRKLKNLLESQQRALVARNLSVFSNLTVSGESIDSTARRLEEIRSYDYHAYTEQLGAIKSAIREQLNASANTLRSDQLVEASEFRKILRLVGAVLVFRRDLIQDDLCQDMRIDCTEFITSFQELIRVQICQAVDGLYTNTDVTMIKEHLRSLKEGFESVKGFADDTFLDFLNLAIADCDECENQAETVAASIGSDVVELRNFDLFVQQLDDVLEKLIRLSNQKSQRRTPLKLQSFSTGANNSDNSTGDGFLHVKDKISKQLDAAIINMMVHMEKDEHDAVRNAFENVTMLMRFDPLMERASEVKLEMTSCVHGQHSRLSDEFREAIRNRQYKAVDKIVNSAAALDKYLHEFLSDGEELLMHKIKAHFKQEVGDIYEDVMRARGVTESDHAQQLCLIKEIVSDISNTEIQEIAEKYITKYLDELKKRKVDFLKLGMLLQQQGNLGAEITEQHAQFKSVLTKRFNESTASITVRHTLTELKKGNPSITDEQIAKLQKFATTYSETFEQDLKTYLPGYGSFRATDKAGLASTIKTKASGLQTSASNSDIVTLLAHVFALHCINTSESMFQETSNDKSCLMKPHPVQVVALLRLLAVDDEQSLLSGIAATFGYHTKGVDGHLIQVGTGEGKSILLGGLSCVLALLGYEVSCASYSKHLSKRDYESFQGLFACLDVNDRVSYSTLSELVEKLINRNGDIREMASTHIFRGSSHVHSHRDTARPKRILLIDEVDVFFSEDFFGSTYNPCVQHSSPETEALLRYIWDNRSSRISLQQIKQLPIYQAVATQLLQSAAPLLDMQISEMITDVNKFNDPPYEVVTLEDGDVRIGYKDQDSVDVNMSYGFRTAFAYLFESSRRPELQKHLSEVLGLSITCGNFSYAKIAQKSFDCVMGVTGTLDCLSAAEKEIVRKDYKITKSTFMPSMYGASKLDFKKDKDVVMEADQNRFFQIILKEIHDEREKGRPVLVYFESTARLEQFVDSEYGRRLSEFNKVTEKTLNLPFFVNKATTTGTVTLMPRVFGRGLDFVSRDPAVDAAGGVHVIQTYFSDYLSEEIQTKGRTARQAKKGSYKMILCGTELAAKLELSIEELQEASATSTFYDTINTKRDEIVAKCIAELKEQSRNALAAHDSTKQLVDLMKRRNTDPRAIISHFCAFNSSKSSEANHIILCLDESGSMWSEWGDLKEAVKEFLNIRMQNGSGSKDIVTVIQFDTDARITADGMSVSDAIEFSEDMECNCGGTLFVPAIRKVQKVLQKDSSGKSPVLVFMTDGASSDQVQVPQAMKKLVSSGLATNLQFYGVAFRTDGGPLQTMANEVQGKVVSAGDVGELVNQFRNIAVSLSANRKG